MRLSYRQHRKAEFSAKSPFPGTSSPWRAFVAFLFAGVVLTETAQGQQTAPAAIRSKMLQVGGGFTLDDPDYSQPRFRGGSVYATLDFRSHLGVEFMFHQENTPRNDNLSERTYELGPRYVWHLSAVEPYVKVSYGRGVFNYPFNAANLAYNMVTGTGGVDIWVQRHIVLRGEYEYQRWVNFPPNALTPQLVTVGAAYRF